MATKIDPPNGAVSVPGKHYFMLWRTVFEVDLRYVPLKPIGKGAYGIVCAARDLQSGAKVAIKRITNVFENATDARRTLREIKLLRHLCHENIIAIKDIMPPPSKHSFKDLYVVYELMDTDLHQIIRSPQVLNDDHHQYLVYQLLRGLKYLHSANVLHRDLKPSNLLLNANCDLKICDFGLARTGPEKGQFMTEYVVTRWYRAPELLLSCDFYGSAIDVWSVGCIFAELLGRKPIFPGKDYLHQLKLILATIGTPDEDDLHFVPNDTARNFILSQPFAPRVSVGRLYPNANPKAIDLIDKMLVFDPRKRITVVEALCHPYFSMLHDENLEPVAAVPFDSSFEDEDIREHDLREKVWEEMLHYHPEVVANSFPTMKVQ